ncbi:hydrogenase expression protein, partial [Pseudonocardia sp. D17]
AT